LKKCTQIIQQSLLLFTLQTLFWAWAALSIGIGELFTPASAIVAKCRRHGKYNFRVQYLIRVSVTM
jgi:hypothetical protein